MVDLLFLILVGVAVALIVGGPMVGLGSLMLGGAARSLHAGRPMLTSEFLILSAAAVSLRVGKPISRARHGPALAVHLVVRFAAALVLGIFTFKAARYAATHG